MGVVYLAEDTLLGRRVAIKFPNGSGDFARRLLSEARAASSLNHPSVATVYDCGEHEGRPYIVMEFVEGESLQDLLKRGRLPVRRAVAIVTEVAEALREAHARHIVHRDIKPANIRITPRGAVKVVDFGLARSLAGGAVAAAGAGASMAATQTVDGMISGTPRYMSPEQVRGASGDERTDLFALGAVMYECFTGVAPFQGQTTIDVLAQVLQVNPEAPSQINPEVAPELDRITLKTLAKEPSARYQSAQELLDDLHAPPPPPSLAQPLARERGRRRRSRVRRASWLSPITAGVIIVAIVYFRSHGVYHPAPEAQRWYEEGTNAIRDGTFLKASRALEQAIRLDSGFALAHARLAEASNALDDSRRAHDEMLKAVPPGGITQKLSTTDALTIQAIYRIVTGDGTGAPDIYREILGHAPNDQKAGIYIDLGRAYESSGQSKQAIESYQEALRRSAQYAAAFLHLGILYGREQDRLRAEQAFAEAEARYRALSNAEGLTEVQFQRGLLARGLGDLDAADRLLEQALETARAGNSLQQEIAAELALSNIDYRKRDMTAAAGHAGEAIHLAQSNGLDLLTARALGDIGNADLARGDFEQAQQHFDQSLEFARRLGSERLESRALLMLGSLHIQQTRLEEGAREVERALPYYQRAGFREIQAQALILLGRARRDEGDYQRAFGIFQEQLALAEKTGSTAQMATAEEGIASVMLRQERYPEAIAHCRRQCALAHQCGDHLIGAYGMTQLGHMLVQLGQFQEARAALGAASGAAHRPGGYSSLGSSIALVEAELDMAQREFRAAREGVRKLLETTSKADASTEIEARRILCLASIASGRAAEGKAACEEALAMARKSAPGLAPAVELTYSEALAATGGRREAEQAAASARDHFARSGQRESEARAWLVTARLARVSGDPAAGRQAAAQAANSLDTLERGWNEEDRLSYESRPDVRQWRTEIRMAMR